MEFRIANTFTDSLARLTGDEQKIVKTTAFDLQLNPANPGFQFHKIDRAKDPNFWSVRASRDIRLIVHKTDASLLLCYVDHHDDAYQWAERRKLETHPKTGAAQLVQIRETVKEYIIPKYVEEEEIELPKQLLFADIPDDDLLSYGVPLEWLDDVHLANEDSVLDLADFLPNEAAEALLEIAVGATPHVVAPAATSANPFEHPDAQRRFRVMSNVEELERALDFPWDRWAVFLHPAQRELVESAQTGPARVSGSAGTGKTIVALHRAVYLARSNPDTRVLLTTFSETLAHALRARLRRLISNEPALGERVEVHSMDAIGSRLHETNIGKPEIASASVIRELLTEASGKLEDNRFSDQFVFTEWNQVVDAWGLETWESYRDVARLGRRTRLPETQRKRLWSVFSHARSELNAKNLITDAEVFRQVADLLAKRSNKPFDHVVIDEAQDISVSQLRFLAALGGDRPDGLFFAGDLGQRIFQQPFSWLSLGVDVRGRSRTLRINYRTSHQIRMRADRLLGPELSDVDGVTENRRGTISVFNGLPPTIEIHENEDKESEAVSRWILSVVDEGLAPHEIGIFVRSADEIDRAITAAESSGIDYKVLDENVQTTSGYISISTMHLAKGLEFRAVAVMACDDEVIPLQARIETVTDDSDLDEVYNTERHLLYVACTRARDHLLVTGVDPASEFLDDLGI